MTSIQDQADGGGHQSHIGLSVQLTSAARRGVLRCGTDGYMIGGVGQESTVELEEGGLSWRVKQSSTLVCDQPNYLGLSDSKALPKSKENLLPAIMLSTWIMMRKGALQVICQTIIFPILGDNNHFGETLLINDRI